MVSRILGMGDVLALIERAEETVDQRAGRGAGRASCGAASSRSRTSATSCKQVRKLGPLDQVLSMLPGVGALKGVDIEAGEREMRRSVAIIDSMTPHERRDPRVINGSRRKRIARGSGTRSRTSTGCSSSTRRRASS